MVYLFQTKEHQICDAHMTEKCLASSFVQCSGPRVTISIEHQSESFLKLEIGARALNKLKNNYSVETDAPTAFAFVGRLKKNERKEAKLCCATPAEITGRMLIMITTSDKINNECNKTSMRTMLEREISIACIKIEKFSFNTLKYLRALFLYLSVRWKAAKRMKNVLEIFHCLR